MGHGADEGTVLEHRDAVGDLVKLVETMRDIKDQHVPFAQPPDEREELRQSSCARTAEGSSMIRMRGLTATALAISTT